MKKVKTMVVVAAVAAGIAAVINKKKEGNDSEKEVNESEEKEEDQRYHINTNDASQFVPKEKPSEQPRSDYLDQEALKEIQRLLEEEVQNKVEIVPIVEETTSFNNEEPIEEAMDSTMSEEDSNTVSLRQLFAATAGVINEEEFVSSFVPQAEENITEEEEITSPFLAEINDYLAKELSSSLQDDTEETAFVTEMDKQIVKELLGDLQDDMNVEEVPTLGVEEDTIEFPFITEENNDIAKKIFESLQSVIEEITTFELEEEEEVASPFLAEIDEDIAEEIVSGFHFAAEEDETTTFEPEDDKIEISFIIEENDDIAEKTFESLQIDTEEDEMITFELEEEEITSPFLAGVDEDVAKEILSSFHFATEEDETTTFEPEEDKIEISFMTEGDDDIAKMIFDNLQSDMEEDVTAFELEEEEEITSPFLVEADEDIAKEILSSLHFATEEDETTTIEPEEDKIESSFITEENDDIAKKIFDNLQTDTEEVTTFELEEEEITSPFLVEVDEDIAKEILSGLQFETKSEESISLADTEEEISSPFLTMVDEPVEEDVLSGLHFGTTIDETPVLSEPVKEEMITFELEKEEEITSPFLAEVDEDIAKEILSNLQFEIPNPFEDEDVKEDAGNTLEKELVEMHAAKEEVIEETIEAIDEEVEDEFKVTLEVENDDEEIEASTVSEEDEVEFDMEVAEEDEEKPMVFVDDDFLSKYKFNDLSQEDLDKYQIYRTPKSEEVVVKETVVEEKIVEQPEEEPASLSTVEEPIEDEVTEESTLFQLYPDMTEDEDDDDDDEEILRKKEVISKMREALRQEVPVSDELVEEEIAAETISIENEVLEEEILEEESIVEEPFEEKATESVLFQLYPDTVEEEDDGLETTIPVMAEDEIKEDLEEFVVEEKTSTEEIKEETAIPEGIILSRSYEDMVREEDGLDFGAPEETEVVEVLTAEETSAEEKTETVEMKTGEVPVAEDASIETEIPVVEETRTEELILETTEMSTEEEELVAKPSVEEETTEPSLMPFDEIEKNYEVDEDFLKELMSRFDNMDDDQDEFDLESFDKDFEGFDEDGSLVGESVVFEEDESLTEEKVFEEAINTEEMSAVWESEVTLVEDVNTDVLNELLNETTMQSIKPVEDLEKYTALDEEDEFNSEYLDFGETGQDDFDSYESELEKLSEAVAKLADIELDQKKNDEMIFTWDDSYQVSPDFVSEMDMMLDKIGAFSSRVEGFQYGLEGNGFLETKKSRPLLTDYEYYNLNWEEEKEEAYQAIDVDWELDEYMEKRLFSPEENEDDALTEGLKYLNKRRLKKEAENKVAITRAEKYQHNDEYEVDPFWSYDDILIDQYIRQPFIPPHSQMNPWGYNYSQPPFSYVNPMPVMNPHQLNFTPGYGYMNFNSNPYMMNPMMNQNPLMSYNPMMNPNMNMYPDTTMNMYSDTAYVPPVEKIVIDEIDELEEIENIQIKKKIVGTAIQKAEKRPEPKIDERRLEELIEQKAFEILMQQQIQQQYQEQIVNVPTQYELMQNEPIQNMAMSVMPEQGVPVAPEDPTPVMQEQVIPVMQEQAIPTSPSLNEYQVVEPEVEPFERDERFPFIDEGIFRKLHGEVTECLNSYTDYPTLNLQHQIFYFDPELQVKLIKQAKQSGYYCYIREDGILLEKVLSNDFDYIFETVLAMANRVLSEFSLYKGVSIFPNEQLN